MAWRFSEIYSLQGFPQFSCDLQHTAWPTLLHGSHIHIHLQQCTCQVKVYVQVPDWQYVRGLDRRAHLSLFVNFALVVLGGSTVDALFVILCCASIAASVPEIRSLKVQKYTPCNYEKMASNPSIIEFVNMAMV